MTRSEFSKALDEALAKLEKLRRERQRLDMDIAKMEQVVSALRQVTGQDTQVETGLTDAVRAVLKRETRRGRSPTEIREGMLAMGFDLGKYSQPLAAIHVVIKRLERSGEVIELGDHPKRYWWALNDLPPTAPAGAEQASGRRRPVVKQEKGSRR